MKTRKNVIIFYSWQSDNRRTKNFIEKALRGAMGELAAQLEISPRLDRDTQGEVGAVDIADTIIRKINECDIFIADVSIIGELASGKKQVNQNVMFELGYAIAKRTATNTSLLFNTDLCNLRDLPFDINKKRVMPFSINNDKEGIELKNKLIGILQIHINHLEQQEIKQVESELDGIELLVMKVLASMSADKRLMVMERRSLWDETTIAADRTVNSALHDSLKALDSREVIATLDDMAKRGLLSSTQKDGGYPCYRPAKAGYAMMKKINKNT